MIAFTQEVPINEKAYGRIKELLGPEPPAGLIVHVAHVSPNGMRYVDVWESQDALDAFTSQRLHPAVGQVLQEFGVHVTEEPLQTPLDVVDVWGSNFTLSSGNATGSGES